MYVSIICHKYYTVKMEVGISNKTIVCFFAESTNNDVTKLHWCFSFQLRKLIYQFP